MPLSVATHCSFSSFLSHESAPVLHIFFVLVSSFLSLTSLSIVLLLVTHLLFSFLIPTLARNYPPRNLPFLTHVTTSPSSFSFPSHYFFCVLFLSLSRSLFLFPVYLLITNTFFFMGINVPFFPQLLTIIHNVIHSLFANSFSTWLFPL
ncbi:hypothetical protein K457DRAFT_867790 [Linnemannia elongata AG-77]|uniref:Uncharacterized protein n=1 Tax=Linnemannia elongata AG-77 TaxID=1314771 RepID=A0A197JGK7_9FUNG|nr:hypothetical protein K457DRAFT_867790 [Linnemannia elongata AG-77]